MLIKLNKKDNNNLIDFLFSIYQTYYKLRPPKTEYGEDLKQLVILTDSKELKKLLEYFLSDSGKEFMQHLRNKFVGLKRFKIELMNRLGYVDFKKSGKVIDKLAIVLASFNNLRVFLEKVREVGIKASLDDESSKLFKNAKDELFKGKQPKIFNYTKDLMKNADYLIKIFKESKKNERVKELNHIKNSLNNFYKRFTKIFKKLDKKVEVGGLRIRDVWVDLIDLDFSNPDEIVKVLASLEAYMKKSGKQLKEDNKELFEARKGLINVFKLLKKELVMEKEDKKKLKAEAKQAKRQERADTKIEGLKAKEEKNVKRREAKSKKASEKQTKIKEMREAKFKKIKEKATVLDRLSRWLRGDDKERRFLNKLWNNLEEKGLRTLFRADDNRVITLKFSGNLIQTFNRAITFGTTKIGEMPIYLIIFNPFSIKERGKLKSIDNLRKNLTEIKKGLYISKSILHKKMPYHLVLINKKTESHEDFIKKLKDEGVKHYNHLKTFPILLFTNLEFEGKSIRLDFKEWLEGYSKKLNEEIVLSARAV